MTTSKSLQAVLAGIVFLLSIVCAGQAAAQTWTQLAPSGGPPPPRSSHVAIFNTAGNRMVIFGGGSVGIGVFNDTWVLSHADGTGGTPTWTQLSPTGTPPSGRNLTTAVYDPATNSMIVFGGSNGIDLNDTWVLSHADGTGGTPAWTQLSPTGTPPTGREGHSAVYDPSSNSLVVFGGFAGGGYENETWVLSHANGTGGTPAWTQLSPTGTPPSGKYLTAAVYDPASNSLVVFGGYNGSSSNTNNTWVLSHADGTGGTPAWIQLSPTGTLPGVRNGHTAVYDPATNSMVVFGGFGFGIGVFNDTWVLSHTDGTGGTPAWTQLSPTGTPPPARSAHTAVYNAANNRMVVFAGNDGSNDLNDTWVLTGASGVIDIPVGIDIRPGTTLNNISLSRDRNIPVAILSTATFDAPGMVDTASLTFGHTGNENSFTTCDAPTDVNHDGRLDLVCHFTIKLSGFVMGDTQGLLKGGTLVGNTIHGSDLVKIIQ